MNRTAPEPLAISIFSALTCKQDLEDIVAKHKAAPYGMEHSWLKIKNPTYSQAEGRHDFFERRKGLESVRAAKLAANA